MAMDQQNPQHVSVTIPSRATLVPLPVLSLEEEAKEAKQPKTEEGKDQKGEDMDAKDKKAAETEGKEGKEGKEKFTDKAMLKVAILVAAISAASILNIPNQIPKEPTFKRFYKAYILMTFITFTVGIGCVALCSILHKPNKNLAVTRGLMWVSLVLIELSMALGASLKIML